MAWRGAWIAEARRRGALALMLLATTLLVLSLSAGCADTLGRPVTVTVAARAADAQGRPAGTFTNRLGWRVSFREARALVGPVYFTETAEASALAWLRHLSPIGVAQAHVAVAQGRVLAEVLEPRVLDLLDPAAELGEARGVSGTCRLLEVHLRAPGTFTPSNPEALPGLNGHGLWVAGTAEREGVRVAFEGGLTLPQEAAELREITNIPVDAVPIDDDTRPALRVDLENWLWNVDFAPLAAAIDPEDPTRPVIIEPGTPAHNAWLRAASARETWHLERQ